MKREPLSVVITTLDNEATLERCLASAAFADEIVVLDSGSVDRTRAIAADWRVRWFEEPFKGYGPQKQSAIDKATHRWVLLLDADEAIPEPCRHAIEAALLAPKVAGYTLPRREQVFWRLQHRAARHNPMLRLIDRSRARLSADGIHAQPVADGAIGAIAAPFEHYGEPDIATKLDKINRYSSAVAADKHARAVPLVWLRLLTQPPLQFLRSYLWKRRFLSGAAGFIAAVLDSVHVFLKYAKVIEHRQRERGRGSGSGPSDA
jgi:glycosyltransferase involved in cell wall biosynthesis